MASGAESTCVNFLSGAFDASAENGELPPSGQAWKKLEAFLAPILGDSDMQEANKLIEDWSGIAGRKPRPRRTMRPTTTPRRRTSAALLDATIRLRFRAARRPAGSSIRWPEIPARVGRPPPSTVSIENNGVNAVLTNPYYYSDAISMIRHLSEHAGFEWILDRGTLAIVPPGQSRQGRAVAISPQTIQVGYPMFVSNLLVVKCLFDPDFAIRKNVSVQSSLTPASGTWSIAKIEHDLEALMPHGKWFSTLSCTRVPSTTPDTLMALLGLSDCLAGETFQGGPSHDKATSRSCARRLSIAASNGRGLFLWRLPYEWAAPGQ
jgi:hypothetical protein